MGGSASKAGTPSSEVPKTVSKHSVRSADPDLDEVLKHVEEHISHVAVAGRYHRERQLLDDYEFIIDPTTRKPKVLGSGYNGQVLLAKNKGRSLQHAVKQFKLVGVKAEQKQELKDEAEIFLQLDHPHVVRLADCFEGPEYLSLVMECMAGGELFKRVLARKVYKENDAAKAVHQMLLAVNYLHGQGIAHRDLKLENFLYESDESDHLKLIDFGFSKICEDGQRMKLSCGTLSYVAPEVLRKNYDNKCDMWSMGVITFILLAGYMPFFGANDDQIRSIKKGTYKIKPEKWKKVSKEGLEFVQRLIKLEPKERLSAAEALADPWLTTRIKSRASSTEQDPSIFDSLKCFAAASDFRRQVLQVMAWSLSNDERAEVREAFIALDKDNSGHIKLMDLKRILQDDFHASPEVVASMDALDADNDDDIEYSDFLSAMCASKIKHNDTLLKETFRRFDTDNSGFIDADNLKELLNLEGDEVVEALKAADTNGDGKIQIEEFMAFVTSDRINEKEREKVTGVIDREVGQASADQLLPTIKSKRRLA